MRQHAPSEPSPKTVPPLPEWVVPVMRLWDRNTARGPFMSGKLGAAPRLHFSKSKEA